MQSTNSTEQQHDRSERETLQYIRDELVRYYPDIPKSHDYLRRAIGDWRDVAFSVRSGDVGSAISQRLTEMSANYKMYRAAELSEDEDAFPERCEGCPHHGIQCPVTTDLHQKKRLERILDEAETNEETVRKVRRFATDNDCHVIADVLDKWTTDLEPVLEAGQKLLQATEDLLIHDDPEEPVKRKVKRARRRGPSAMDPSTSPEEGDSDAGTGAEG